MDRSLPAAPAPAGVQARRVWPRWFAFGCGCGLTLCLAAGLLGWLGWRSMVRLGVGSDLEAYARFTRQSGDLPAADQTALLAALARLERRNRNGEIGFVEWIRAAQVGDPVIEDGRVEPAEAGRLLRALELMQGPAP